MTEYLYPRGWYLQYELGTSGLNLYNIRHANYRLANDVRIAGIWVGSDDPNDPAKPKDAALISLKLGGPDLPNATFAPPPGPGFQSPPVPFDKYGPLFTLNASFKTKDPVLGPNTDSEFLEIIQDYQFGSYGMNPPHEPGAVLQAARFFPLLKFNISGAGKNKVKYLRVDFRFHLNLDSLGFDPEVRKQKQRSGQDVRGSNQAGIFRDRESVPFPLQFRTGGIFGPGGIVTPANIGDVYAAAEKPLQYEIGTRGLTHGRSADAGQPDTWDNYHQWGSPYGGLLGSPLPTTPGAFHCAHLHWRWGAASGDPSRKGILLKAAGDPQFRGLGWTEHTGGPLLDERVPDQSIRFAVTKNFNHNLESEILSTQKFEDLFISQRAVPDSVKSGADLVLWYSVEVFRDIKQLQQPWEGSLFIHGLYFAHDPEPLSFTSLAGNLSEKLLKPTPTQKWQRYAM
jgi:hypothetical protein